MMTSYRTLRNGYAVPLPSLPTYSMRQFRDAVLRATHGGYRLAALFHMSLEDRPALCAVVADDKKGELGALAGILESEGYPALTPECMQAHLFEREIAEETGILPIGHPWLKPVRFPRKEGGGPGIGDMEFFRVEGSEIHEVAVGPVHAGVIEPGHFRFQCYGEIVLHLEISLGYQHRGVEKGFLEAAPSMRRLMVESVSGDSTVGHCTAYCNAVEALSGCPRVPERAAMIRSIAQELERAACHIGDLGALAGDVGFLPTMSFCGRIRGDVLNMNAAICGNRFSRGLIHPGGVSWDIDESIARQILDQLQVVRADTKDAVSLLWETPTVLARFEGTGALSRADAEAFGLVGPAARACGLVRDVRSSFPYGGFALHSIPFRCAETGDVLARAFVRSSEIECSFDYVERHVSTLPDTPLQGAAAPLQPSSFVVSLAEGWRGEILHAAATDRAGALSRYKIVDPSFHNWFALAMSMRNRGISDFPLCNKSFNLSYCGFDL